ncbi:MAG: hypothetical protein ACM31O_21695 [Bacteroidota bacterium]|jgi:hypothetical protein
MRIIPLALTFAAGFFTVVSAASADTYVRGYTRRDGTYVQPHYQTNPDGNKFNNYSTQGNVNPYTGKPGTVDPFNSLGSTNSNSGYGLYGKSRRGF